MSKRLVPWYDERFTGYLEDKVVHIQTMVHMGFTFAVHPSAFVVHYPHPDSKDQALIKTTHLMTQVGAASLPSTVDGPLQGSGFAFQRHLLPFPVHGAFGIFGLPFNDTLLEHLVCLSMATFAFMCFLSALLAAFLSC